MPEKAKEAPVKAPVTKKPQPVPGKQSDSAFVALSQSALSNPAALTPAKVLALQRLAGNQAVQRFLAQHHAQVFRQGQTIYPGAGKENVESSVGQQLLADELHPVNSPEELGGAASKSGPAGGEAQTNAVHFSYPLQRACKRIPSEFLPASKWRKSGPGNLLVQRHSLTLEEMRNVTVEKAAEEEVVQRAIDPEAFGANLTQEVANLKKIKQAFDDAKSALKSHPKTHIKEYGAFYDHLPSAVQKIVPYAPLSKDNKKAFNRTATPPQVRHSESLIGEDPKDERSYSRLDKGGVAGGFSFDRKLIALNEEILSKGRGAPQLKATLVHEMSHALRFEAGLTPTGGVTETSNAEKRFKGYKDEFIAYKLQYDTEGLKGMPQRIEDGYLEQLPEESRNDYKKGKEIKKGLGNWGKSLIDKAIKDYLLATDAHAAYAEKYGDPYQKDKDFKKLVDSYQPPSRQELSTKKPGSF